MSEEAGPNRRALLVAATVAGAILLGFLGWRLAISLSQTEIVLKPEAVDPRDPFRGDFVILNYPESRLSLAQIGGSNATYPRGADVYVVMADASPAHRLARVAPAKPDLAPGEACMRGEVRSSDSSGLRVEYGIESYFVPEGRGREVEDALREGRVLALVKSGPGCNVGLSTLLIDGDPWP